MLTLPAPLYRDYAKKSSTNCDSNPNRGYGKHGAPQEDGNVAFAMLEFDEVVESLCPGADYNFSVSCSTLYQSLS